MTFWKKLLVAAVYGTIGGAGSISLAFVGSGIGSIVIPIGWSIGRALIGAILGVIYGMICGAIAGAIYGAIAEPVAVARGQNAWVLGGYCGLLGGPIVAEIIVYLSTGSSMMGIYRVALAEGSHPLFGLIIAIPLAVADIVLYSHAYDNEPGGHSSPVGPSQRGCRKEG